MRYRAAVLIVTALLVPAAGGRRAAAGTPTRKPPAKAKKDIVPPGEHGPTAKLLRAWHKEGTAAGNTGDFYDNRDGGHSRVNIKRLPQLRAVEYSEEQRKRKLHWGVQLRMLFKHVTIGNSSTASSNMNWGSNTRRCLLSARAMQVLYTQYTRNHLYVYPEHRDHDPGHNGRGGYGDLFPANTPYVINSQGSSGSDQPFVAAVAYTLAAFRPEVKGLLVQKGLLMPTVQMIFRACNQNLSSPQGYLTGKAHPTVFARRDVGTLKMVQMAHAIRLETVPPMIQLAVVEEDRAVAGRDYFDVGERERLFDTPAAIARIGRSTRRVRRMVVSARGSYDVNRRPLKYHWVVLRGDADRIKIQPRNKDASVVELQIPFHERRPIHPGGPMESTRVDIGAFVHNGAYYSAPGFVCFYFLDGEARTYDAHGRILEVGYDYGDSTIGYPASRVRARDPGYDVTDWPALLGLLHGDDKGLAAVLLRKRFTAAEVAELRKAANELDAACEREKEPRKQLDEVEATRKKARAAADEAKKKLDELKKKARGRKPTDAVKAALAGAEGKLKALQEAQKKADQQLRRVKRELDQAQRAAHQLLTRKRPALAGSIKQRLEEALNTVRNDMDLYFANAEAIRGLWEASQDARRKKAFLDARAELVKIGLLKAEGKDRFSLRPILGGTGPPAARLTKYERNRIEWFNIAILQNVVYPGLLNRRYTRNFVNPFIATPKSWRDVYHYDAKGRLIGWTRHRKGEKEEFTADGALITKKDRLGRALEARTVQYAVRRGKRAPEGLIQKPGDTILHYEYDSDEDRVGRIRKPGKDAP